MTKEKTKPKPYLCVCDHSNEAHGKAGACYLCGCRRLTPKIEMVRAVSNE